MAEALSRDRLYPSLLDRLLDDEPGKLTEPRENRAATLSRLRENVLRDLSWLFNATQSSIDFDDDRLPQAIPKPLYLRLEVGLVLLGDVILGVLLEIAELARPLDPLRDLTAERAAPVLELGRQPLVGGGGELRGIRGFHRARVPALVPVNRPW